MKPRRAHRPLRISSKWEHQESYFTFPRTYPHPFEQSRWRAGFPWDKWTWIAVAIIAACVLVLMLSGASVPDEMIRATRVSK